MSPIHYYYKHIVGDALDRGRRRKMASVGDQNYGTNGVLEDPGAVVPAVAASVPNAVTKPIPITRRRSSIKGWMRVGSSGSNMGKTQEADTVSESAEDSAVVNGSAGGDMSGGNTYESANGGTVQDDWKKHHKKKKKKKHSFASLFSTTNESAGEKSAAVSTEEKAAPQPSQPSKRETKSLSSSPKHYRTVPTVARDPTHRRQVLADFRYVRHFPNV